MRPARFWRANNQPHTATSTSASLRPRGVINTEVARWSRWLRYPEGQIHALRAAAPLIAAMPPAQVARLAAILRLDHATVTQAVTDALTQLITHPGSHHQRAAGHATTSRPSVHAASDDIPTPAGCPPAIRQLVHPPQPKVSTATPARHS
jgi:hypothetical protein